MRFASLYFLSLVLLMTSATLVDDFPQAEITNGLIQAKLYLPDAEKGYYRGSRFDWAGVMPELKYKNHSYFGQWFDRYDPTLHDAIMGPVEAFDPIGLDQAKPGESFIKIGIGTLIKPDEKPYHFATPYKILDAGKWSLKKQRDQIEFVHQLQARDYGYEYTKTLQLTKDKAELVLVHSLKNTGKIPLETQVYNHNFFVIDDQQTGPDFQITFPFPLVGERRSPVDVGGLDGNKVVYTRVLNRGENLFFYLTGYGESAKDNDVRIENRKTGAGVRIVCDLPISRLVYWSAYKTVCPEPYSRIKVAPGQTTSWKVSYEFYTLE